MNFFKVRQYLSNFSNDEINNLKSFVENPSLEWSPFVEVVELSQSEEYDFLLKHNETGELYTKYVKYERDEKEGIFCYVYADDTSEYDNETHVVYDFQNVLKIIQYRLQFEYEQSELQKKYHEGKLSSSLEHVNYYKQQLSIITQLLAIIEKTNVKE